MNTNMTGFKWFSKIFACVEILRVDNLNGIGINLSILLEFPG